MTDFPPPVRDSAAIGPLNVLRMTRAELVARTRAALEPGAPPVAVAFCNAHTAEIALRDDAYAAALGRFVLVNDGIGLEIAARLLEGRGFPDNLNGTDFVPGLFADLDRPTTAYLVGAAPGVAEEVGRRFAARFARLRVVGARDGYFRADEEETVVREIAAAGPDILLVAFGNPKQEMFIARHFDALGARAMFGVGALFDFTADRVARAPAWIRRARLEWAFRLAQEPRRLLRRYTIETARFLIAVLRFRASGRARRNP